MGVTPTIAKGQDAACPFQPWEQAALLLPDSCKAFWDKRSMARVAGAGGREEGSGKAAGQGQRKIGVQSTGREVRSPFVASAVCWQSVAFLDFRYTPPTSACARVSVPFRLFLEGD